MEIVTSLKVATLDEIVRLRVSVTQRSKGRPSAAEGRETTMAERAAITIVRLGIGTKMLAAVPESTKDIVAMPSVALAVMVNVAVPEAVNVAGVKVVVISVDTIVTVTDCPAGMPGGTVSVMEAEVADVRNDAGIGPTIICSLGVIDRVMTGAGAYNIESAPSKPNISCKSPAVWPVVTLNVAVVCPAAKTTREGIAVVPSDAAPRRPRTAVTPVGTG